MIISLSEECEIFKPNNEVHLHQLMLTLVSKWHAIAHPSPNRLESILPPHVWRLYGDFLRQAYKTIANSKRTWVSHTSCSMCDPENLARFYSLPALLIVENAATDGEWVRLVAQQLRPALAKLFGGRHPSISVVQAGGIGEIPKELRRHARDYGSVRPAGNVPSRILVLADSDAKRPNEPSGQARKVETEARSVGVSVHILRKRSIENYVPDGALLEYARSRADRMSAVRRIIALSGPARDHYPMKSGLASSDASEPGLYSQFDLRVGLGDFMADLIENFYHSMTPNELRRRDGCGELDALLDELEKNL